VGVATRPFIRRRLGRELAKIREDRTPKLTAEQVASQVVLPDRTRLAASSISRIETAKMSVRPSTIAALLKVYGTEGERREALMRLAREAGSEAYWHPYTGRKALPKWFEMYIDLENEASSLATFDSQLINGLAQTEDYARAVFKGQGATGTSLDRKVQLRLDRQTQVERHGTELQMIIDESVLLRRYGTVAQFRAQLGRLAELADARRLKVLSLTAQTPAVGSFIVLDFAEVIDPSVVYAEHESGALYLESGPEVANYQETYQRLDGASRSYTDSAELIHEVRKT
jgi:hypothetical protein